jgi:tRNA modification GTPase
VSALADCGAGALLDRLDELVRERFVAHEGALVNERQRAAVAESASAVQSAIDSAASGLDEQMILVDLYRSANALALLTGAITRDDVFTEIFSRFCIGK